MGDPAQDEGTCSDNPIEFEDCTLKGALHRLHYPLPYFPVQDFNPKVLFCQTSLLFGPFWIDFSPMQTLAFKTRKDKEKLSAVRARGEMPAVFYGRLEKSTPISVSLGNFKKLFRTAGESTVISLSGDGEHEALIHEVQFHPVTGEPMHADFYVIEKGKALEVDVPLEFIGESPAVKSGGILIKVMHELPISALPKDLPHNIEVDISVLKEIGDNISVGGLKLPEGVTTESGLEEVVVSVAAPKEEVVEEVPVDLSAIEVEK
ncbi:MAG: 50S ribosomal protein L25, partial [Patescibacteria group bacterium]